MTCSSPFEHCKQGHAMRPLTEILLTKANFKYFSTLSMYREMPILTPEIPTRNSSACFCIFSSCIFNSEGVIKKRDAQPITHTSDALLMTIIGGVGTLIGPALGAGVLQLLGYWLSNTFGQSAAFGLAPPARSTLPVRALLSSRRCASPQTAWRPGPGRATARPRGSA